MYVAVHDATSRVIAGAFGKARGEPKSWYLQPDRDELPRGLTGADLEAAVDAMALAYPGRVKSRAN